MTDSLALYQLSASPNSIKCRLALGLKKLPCKIVDTGLNEDDDRRLVELSGQSLRPVLVHEGRAVYDSHAILRYLDANWKAGPRLFAGADADAQHDIEDWERFAREELRTSIGMIFGQMFAKTVDPKEVSDACALLAKNCMRVEEALSKTACLMGEQPNAADLTVAAFVGHGLLDPATQKHPFAQFFSKHLRLPETGFDRTRAWCKKVLAFDPAPM